MARGTTRGAGPGGRRAAAPVEDPRELIARLLGDAGLTRRDRIDLLRRLAVALGASARRAGSAKALNGSWLSDVVEDVAPHLPIRDLAALQHHHPGLTGDALARVLVDTASRATAAVGAAGGVVASLEFTAPPLLLSTPVQLAAETVAVVAIEVKLVGELHEVYGQAAAGTPAVRTAAYLGAWTRRRALEPGGRAPGLSGVLGGAARRELRRRLVRRTGGNLTSMLPFMAGAVAAGSLNSRETRRLGERVARELGGRLA